MTGLTGAIVAIAALTATAAIAQQTDTVSVRVKLGDLNLSQSDGAAAALARIDGAARVICGEAPILADLSGSAQYRRCIAAAVDNGVGALSNPLVTAMNEARQDHRQSIMVSTR